MLTLAVLLMIAAVAALRLAWHWGRNGRPRHRLALRWAGWTLLAISLWPWAAAGGSDRGVALALLVLMLAGLVLVLREGRKEWTRPRRARRERQARENGAAPASGPMLLMRRVWIFFLAGPLALASSLALGLVLWLALERWGVASANVLAVGMLAVPLCWAALMIAASMDSHLGRRSLAVTVPGVVATLGCLTLAGGTA